MAALTTRTGCRTVGIGVGLGALALIATHIVNLTPVSATSNTIGINGRDALGIGLQDVYTIVLSDPAPPTNLQVTVDSNDANCVLAHTENDLGSGTPLILTVPAGRQRASFVVQTVSGATGTCDITATASAWVTGSLSIPLVQGKLRIRDLVRHIGPFSDADPFFVEVGVPTSDGEHLRYVQGRSKQLGDLTVTVCSDQPSIGTIVNVFGQDAGNDGCEDNPVFAPFTRTVPGDFQFDPVSGSTTPVLVAASAPGFLGDERNVNVRALSVTTRGPEELGAGLQDNYTALLSDEAPSNLTVTISVPDTTSCVVADSEQALGKLSIQRVISAGRFRTEFVVQGVAATAPEAPCVVTVDAGIFGTDTVEIDIKTPALRLRDLVSTIGQFAPNDGFFVDLGVADPYNRGLRFVQQLRKGTDPTPNSPLTVTVKSDDKTIGTIVDVIGVDNGNDGEETAPVQPAFSRTVPGVLQFDPIMGSATKVHVTATAPGFDTIEASEQDVEVRTATLQLTGPDELGSWLQDEYKVELQASSGHPATTVTLTSLTPDTCTVSPNANTVGTPAITRTIAAGDSTADFSVQAAEMVADVDCQIQATASGYAATDLHVTIRQPGIRIRNLQHSFAVDSSNDAFFVEVGLPNTNGTDLRRVQKLRKESTVAFQVCSSDKAVGTIVDVLNVDNGDDGCEDDTILGAFANNVPGDLKFDPIAVGSTTVTVTAAGFLTMDRTGVVEVKVGGDSVIVSLPPAVGSGLQEFASVRLTSAAGAGGVTVTLTSQTTDKCLVDDDGSSPGTTSAQVTIPQGQRSASFVVSALEGVDGAACRIKATASGFLSDEQETDIAAAGLQIVDLDTSTGTTAPPATFTVQIGVPRRNGTGLRLVQPVRIGGVAVPVTACSETTTVGNISGAIGGCLTKSILPGQFEVSFTFVVTGTTGSTKITVNGASDTEMKTVRVAQTVVNLQSGPGTLGKNLQATYFAVANNNGGVTINAHAEPSSVCVLSLDASTLGDGTDLTVVIAPGTARTPLVVQALDTGDCTVTLSGGGVPDSTRVIPVVQSRVRIRALSSSLSFRAPNDPFFVDIGPVNAAVDDVLTNRDNRSGITRPLPRRAGAPLTVRVCSNAPAIALVHDPDNTPIPPSPPTPQCVTATIPAGESMTGNFEFDPVSNGTVEVTASAPTEVDVDDTLFAVDVRAEALEISGVDSIGKDLQAQYSAVFSAAPPTGTTVTVTATLATCGVAALETDPPAAQITIPVPAGRSRADFWVQGLQTGACTLTVSTLAPGFPGMSVDLDIVTPGVQIRGLDNKRSTLSANEEFKVLIGVPANNLKNLRLVQEVRPHQPPTYPLPVTDGIAGIPLKVCSSNTAVGVIVGGIADGNCRKGVIEPLHSSIDVFEFDAVGPGTTIVSVEENGVPLIVTERGIVAVTVVPSTISVAPEDDLGVDLQDQYRVVLSAALAADANATIQSLTPAICLVAPDDDGPFGASATVSIQKGHSRASFTVQGLATGECRLSPSTTASGYTPVDASFDVVLPTLRIVNLDTSRALQSKNVFFNVDLGIPGPRLREMAQVQAARVGSTGIPVTVCSSNTTVGVIVGAAADGCKTVTVAEMESRSANGSLEFDAVGQGTTTVCASSPGFIMIPPSCRDVRVSGIATNINGHDDLGSYLQDEYVLALSSAVASNSTFTITSTTPSLCKVAVNLLDVGVNSITVTVPQGRSRASFFVHGMDGVSGTCVLTATPPAGSGITDGLREIAIVTPGLKIVNLDGQRSTQATNDKFNVKTGVPQANLRDLAFTQAPRAGGGGVDLKVCSSNPTVGVIVGAGSDGCKTVNLPATESQTPDGLLEFDALAAGTTTICVYVDGFITTDAGCRDVVVASIVPNVNGPDQLGNGLQDSYTLVLSSAVANDATFTIASVTPAQCKLAPNATTAGTNAISVTVPAGRARATFYVQGFDEGTCDLTVTAPAGAGISDGQAEIQIVTPALRILNLDGSRSTQSQNDPFNVEIGIPQPNLKSLATAQAIRAGAAALSIPVCSSNTTVGIVVGAGSDGCKTVTLGAGASRTAEGVLEFDPLNGGNTTVCAGAVGYIATDAACRDIVVSAVAININGPDTLGANLEDQYTLALSAGVSVDTTFTVTSLTPAVCKLSVSRTIAGIPTIALTIPKGRSRADFYVHGIDVGACSLSVTTAASGYGSGLSDIDVVPPGLRILNLAGNLKTGGTDDPFDVEIGVPQGNLKTLARVQELRAGSANLTITACSSNIAAATVVGSGSDPYCKTGYITANATRPTPSAFAVHAVAVGASTISVSAPDFISTDAASKDVTVASGTISISGPDAVGAGLQDTFTVNLNPKAAATGGVPITLTSLTPTLCKVAQDIETAGGTTYALTIAKGKSMAKIAIQALENVTGTCLIRSTTTDPAYVGEDTSVEIVQPGVRIRSLDPTTTVASATDEFFIDVGVPKDNLANLRLVQTVRAGAPALLVKACSSSPTVAAVVGAAGDGCKSVYIAAGDSATAKGDLVLQPLNAGSTIIDARSTGYITTDAGSVDVYVASAALSFSETNIDRVGSGLMDTFNLKSSATVGVDTPVTVTSLSPDVCRVAVDESSASAISTTVTIKAGRQKQTFAIHGLENATGACQLRATYSGFADGYASYDIVSPALRIDGLGTSKSTTSGDDSFTVQVGVAKADLKNLQVKQKVRIGAPTLTITVCSSDPFVGKILVSSVLDTCRTVYLAGGQSDTASGVVKFRVVAGGTTTVDAASPGYIVTDAGTVDVTVSGAGLALSIESTSANAIGAGLQRGSFYVERTGSTSSAITTTVTVLTPTLCKVASSGTAGGVTALAVTIASGSTTSGYFWVQGLENQLGNCQLQVSASGYPTGSGDVDIVRPAIRVTNIAGSIGSTAANDPFNVEIGIADDSQTTLAEVQQVRAGSLGFSMTVANSNAASGVLVGSNGLNQQVTGQSITVKINAGQSANTTGALQRLEFDPDDSLAASTGTTISASHPDAISTAGATQTVVVVLGSGC